MQIVVIIALIASVAFIAIWVVAQAQDMKDGHGVFEIQTKDPVSRTVLRAVQAAFVIGYGGFFALGAGYLLLQL